MCKSNQRHLEPTLKYETTLPSPTNLKERIEMRSMHKRFQEYPPHTHTHTPTPTPPHPHPYTDLYFYILNNNILFEAKFNTFKMLITIIK